MNELNEAIEKNLQNVAQIKHRRQLEIYSKQKQEKKRHDALAHQIGEVVLACWPWTAKLKPYRKKVDRDTELAPLRELLLESVSAPNYSTPARPPSSHPETDGAET